MYPLVSIIVPIYNAEKYLERCINSILAQEYTHFELLLMDDGSTDRSPQICDHFAAQDTRIKVIHKENSGVSDTRNMALDLAQGDYIQFLDSDDWITPDATKNFVQSAVSNGCDLVISAFYRVVGDSFSPKSSIDKEGLLTREEFADEMMDNPADFYYGVLWNKFFKRSIIEKYHIRMEKDISWCEDFIFNLEYLRHCRVIFSLKNPTYYYVKVKGSLVNSQSINISRIIRMKLTVFEYYQQFFKSVYAEESYDNIRFQIYRFLLSPAKDSFVPPAPLSRKLDPEPLLSCQQAISEGDLPLSQEYRYRKLRRYYYETTALKHDLLLESVLILHSLSQNIEVTSISQLSTLTGLSKRKLSLAIQQLELKELISRCPIPKQSRVSPDGERKKTIRRHRKFVLTSQGFIIAQDIIAAQRSFRAILLQGFTPEEQQQLEQLEHKMNENIKFTLNAFQS